MRPPLGYGELSGEVMKLLKYRYGPKQADREWHLLLVIWLAEKVGMEQCKVDVLTKALWRNEFLVHHAALSNFSRRDVLGPFCAFILFQVKLEPFWLGIRPSNRCF